MFLFSRGALSLALTSLRALTRARRQALAGISLGGIAYSSLAPRPATVPASRPPPSADEQRLVSAVLSDTTARVWGLTSSPPPLPASLESPGKAEATTRPSGR